MSTCVAYHGDPAIKRKYVRRIKSHMAADRITQGVGWEQNGVTRGCAVGCTFNKYDHTRGPIEIGVPKVLMHIEDAIFEGLPRAAALKWPLRFLSAIKPGADLSLVHHRFLHWLLTDRGFLTITDVNRAAIAQVANLHRRSADGEKVSESEWAAAAAASAASAAAARADSIVKSWNAMADKLIELLEAA